MIKLENYEVMGWEHAIRGMRNPMNSWEKCDSDCCWHIPDLECDNCRFQLTDGHCDHDGFVIGPNDHKLMMNLRNAGTDHRKYMRMIAVYVDIAAPLYWWKEFDTYKVGTVANSCSTMHKVHEKEFTIEDFSCERLEPFAYDAMEIVINRLEYYRKQYNNARKGDPKSQYNKHDMKACFDNMIQLLPSSYNQKRTVMLNYEVLANMYKSRKAHKLDEWVEFCKWIEELPYSELITGNFEETEGEIK